MWEDGTKLKAFLKVSTKSLVSALAYVIFTVASESIEVASLWGEFGHSQGEELSP